MTDFGSRRLTEKGRFRKFEGNPAHLNVCRVRRRAAKGVVGGGQRNGTTRRQPAGNF
jgi:hypothetical protein